MLSGLSYWEHGLGVCVHVTSIWYNKTTTTGLDNVESLLFRVRSTALGTHIELVTSVALSCE